MAARGKRPQPPASPSSARFDAEAAGLILAALGILLAFSLYLPSGSLGGLEGLLRSSLRTGLGWGSWFSPFPFLLYGAALFFPRLLQGVHRLVWGGLAGIGAALAASDMVHAELGGRWLQGLAQRAAQFSEPLSFLVLLLVASLALEWILRRPAFSLLRGAARSGGRSVRWLAAQLSKARRLAAEARDRSALRAEVERYAADLTDLAQLSGGDLGGQLERARSLSAELAAQDPAARAASRDQLAAWQQSLAALADRQRRVLALAIASEAPADQAARVQRLAALPPCSVPAQLQRSAPLLQAWQERLRGDAASLQAEARQLIRLAEEQVRATERASVGELLRAQRDHVQRLSSWKSWVTVQDGWASGAAAYAAWVDWIRGLPVAADWARLDAECAAALAEFAPPPQAPIDLPPASPPGSEALPPSGTQPTRGGGGVVFELDFSALEAPLGPPEAPVHAVQESLGAIPVAKPGFDLLDPIPAAALDTRALEIQARSRAELINATLAEFSLQGRVVDLARGPTVTRYELEPAPGEKISRIASLANDIARALAVGSVRIEAPVPGKSVIGLEVPNAEREPVTFHAAAAHAAFLHSRARLPLILGKSIDGDMLIADLARMPHLLIAGSTGSGKSVSVNTLIMSLIYTLLPQQLRFIMVDPKMVELTPYDGIPHLVRPVVTNPSEAASVLLGAVGHMERRYKMMSQLGAKNLDQYNQKVEAQGGSPLPYLIIIIDELADLMITSPKEVESAIMRLAQMARATGMHLILATQRPSVDILTSLIKVNVPARLAFAVSSSHDSRTILDSTGAERLTGMGDLLFYQPGLVKPVRLQAPYISENETVRITDFLRRQIFEDDFAESYADDFEDGGQSQGPASPTAQDFSDPYLRQAAEICIEEGQGSVSRLQRRLSVGHARAGKLMDLLEAMGIVSKHQGSKPREVLIGKEDLPEYFGR